MPVYSTSRSSLAFQYCFRFLQVEFDLVEPKFHIWDRAQCIMEGVIRRSGR